jgi:hypothetical protein
VTHPGAQVVEEYLRSLRMGKPQVLDNIILFPLRSWLAGPLPYLSLAEATAAGLLQITEIRATGGPPDLDIRNTATRPVLLLSGEELGSARAKWLLNNAVLLEESAETRIPASCFDRHRSGRPASPILELVRQSEISRRQSSAIPPSRFVKFRPDHSTSWSRIDILRDKRVPRKPFKEIADPVEVWRQMLTRAREVFRRTGRQKGMLVLAGSGPIGFDVVSEESCFARQHANLVRRYIANAMLTGSEGPTDIDKATEIAKAYLDEALRCRGEAREAVACGADYVFRGPSMFGSALVHRGRVIHVAFHRLHANLVATHPAASGSGQRPHGGGPIGLVEPRSLRC